MIKILSGHHVQPQLGFRQTGAFFGQPMSDDRLLFAAWGLPLLTCLNNNLTGDVQCPNCCEPKFLVEDCDDTCIWQVHPGIFVFASVSGNW